MPLARGDQTTDDGPQAACQNSETRGRSLDVPYRVCSHCGASSRISEHEAVWPLGWECPGCGARIDAQDEIPVFAPELADTVSGMDPAAFELLARLEDGNFWFVPRSRLIEGLLRHYFPEAKSFMEIGCGTGFVLSGIAKTRTWRRLVGSELHPRGLMIARRRLDGRAELVQMDARMIPAINVFDVIGAFDVLEHIDEDETVLANMHKAVRPGGGILVTVPQHPWLWSKTDDQALHVRRYRRGELEQKVRAAGFRVLFSGSYTALLLPLMATSRIAPWSRNQEGLSSELAISHVPNAMLRSILQLEVRMTLAGLRFPAGGSRVIVAARPAT